MKQQPHRLILRSQKSHNYSYRPITYGSDAVCKRLKKYNDSIALIPTNSEYDPMIFSREEIESKPVRIIGRVV